MDVTEPAKIRFCRIWMRICQIITATSSLNRTEFEHASHSQKYRPTLNSYFACLYSVQTNTESEEKVWSYL